VPHEHAVLERREKEQTMKELLALGLAVAGLVFRAGPIGAQTWREQHKTVTFGLCELEKDTTARGQQIVDYLSEQTGVKVLLRTGPDYASMIDQMAGGGLDFLSCGPLPYATAYDRMGGNLEPLVMVETKDMLRGYYIVLLVRADSPYRSLDDLRGKMLALPDANSTSSFALPRAYMNPDAPFFASLKISGSHGNGIAGVVKGTYDCAVTWAYSESSSAITGLIEKGQIGANDVKVIWRSSVVPNHCVCAPKGLPPEMKAAFRRALLDFARKDPGRHAQYAPDLSHYVPARHDDYAIAFEVMENQKNARRLLP
jgi:phosphonate transport system substrate-binding protein